ncbi:MAG TPA: autotransporter outer membrane beta-barrel domain-containing protein [Caulobacteraceae bacterium]|jgi:hypothetical protein|nr:autotransporter outer membrane beta-barrel domain-containing protein [Caulobacteraceae bacterium]
MTRKLLAAAAAMAPLVLAAAHAQVTISSNVNTPVATATANNGQPADVIVTGSIGLTAGPGPALTINSNNDATNQGQIGATDISGTAAQPLVGVQMQGGFTSPNGFTNTGSILLTESYVASTDNNTGLLYGAYASGAYRNGVQVIGATPWVGNIITTGSITVNGNDSYGVAILGPMTGAFTMQTVSPTTFTSSTTVTLADGSITALGSGSTGFYIAPAGSISGNVTLQSISATGTPDTTTGRAANAVNILGNVGGTLNIGNVVQSTGYRTTARGSDPTIEAQYQASSLGLGSAAVVVGGSVGGGIIISAPQVPVSTTNPDVDANGVPDAQQTTGQVASYGSAPAMVLGQPTSTGVVQNAVLGVVGAGQGVVGEGGAGAYGLVNQGSILGSGVFDPINEPNIGSPVSATGLQIGTGGTNTFTITGGIYNTGSIGALAYQADATAIHFLAGGILGSNGPATGVLLNDGQILASSVQVSSSTTLSSIPGIGPVDVYGILIEAGAVVPSIVNNGSIIANVTGSGGYGANEIGAIVDRSGTLSAVRNTGYLNAQPTQTVEITPMPVVSTVAIDMSSPLATGPQSVTQQVDPAIAALNAPNYDQTATYTVGQVVVYQGGVYKALTTLTTAEDPVDFPSGWRQIGASSPQINGSILFGNGGSTLSVSAGTINAPVLDMGTGSNLISIEGAANSGPTSAVVTGYLQEGSTLGSSQLKIDINNGTLSDTNPHVLNIDHVTVGANGVLQVAADPQNNTNTLLVTSGASSFAQGAQIGLNLLSIPKTTQETFTILETSGTGTLTAGTFGATPVGNAPFLFAASAAFVPAAAGSPAEIQLTVQQKTPAQLGFNRGEGEALNAVLEGAAASPVIEQALLSQTTQASLRSIYDQLLPNQGQGLFDALDSSEEAISGMTATDPTNRKAPGGATSLWMQEVNQDVRRTNEWSPATYAKLVGFVGGWEHLGAAGGALGVTFAYLNGTETTSQAELGSGVTAQMIEGGLYYRRMAGPLQVAARAGVGVAFFDGDRTFISPGYQFRAKANWDALFYDAHFSVAYEPHLGRFYVRPTLSADYLGMREAAYNETGGGAGFDLSVRGQTQSRLTGTALMVVGREWGREAWLRTELRAGFREVLAGDTGLLQASYAGGDIFGISPDDDSGGWATVGFSLKAGSASSYFALEGDYDYRSGEQRYDIRIAGRSVF